VESAAARHLDAMAANKKDTEDTQAQPPAPRRLLRSRSERVLWGVAGGLAEYLRVDPTWVRLGFVAAVFFGGFGALAYLVMAVVVPEDDGSGAPVSGRRPPTWALVLLGIAVIFVLPGPFFWGWGHGGGWWWGFGGPFWLALLVVAGVLAYRAISGRPLNLFGRRGADEEGSAKGASGSARKSASEQATAEPGEPPRVARALALIALVLLAICCACALAGLSVWATATGSGAVIAGVVIALGVALAAIAFITDARRGAPWLLALALVLALPAGATAAADVRFDGGIGEQEYTPTSVAEIPADGYEHGMGRLVVDLRELAWADGQVVPLRADLGIGQLVVSVPENVCVVGDADAKAGHLLIRGESNGGVDPEFQRGDPSGEPRRLDLDGEIQLGELVVTDKGPDEFDDRREDSDDDDDEAEQAHQDEACER
jgi:phage shock protein PspC (stress-responsive transcriptional regulator)